MCRWPHCEHQAGVKDDLRHYFCAIFLIPLGYTFVRYVGGSFLFWLRFEAIVSPLHNPCYLTLKLVSSFLSGGLLVPMIGPFWPSSLTGFPAPVVPLIHFSVSTLWSLLTLLSFLLHSPSLSQSSSFVHLLLLSTGFLDMSSSFLLSYLLPFFCLQLSTFGALLLLSACFPNHPALNLLQQHLFVHIFQPFSLLFCFLSSHHLEWFIKLNRFLHDFSGAQLPSTRKYTGQHGREFASHMKKEVWE